MSESDVELARQFTVAFNARDVDGMLACCHPQVEFHSSFAHVGGALYEGHDGMQRWYADIEAEWGSELRAEAEALFDVGENTLTYTVLHGRGMQMPIATVSRSRDGLFIFYKAFIHREDALAELGVAEDELTRIAP